MEKYIVYCCCILFFYQLPSCCEKDSLEQSLSKASANRAEIEKVLHFYENEQDDLKYRSACFLLENMRGNYSLESPQIWNYYRKSDSIFLDLAIQDQYELRLDTLLRFIETDKITLKWDLENITTEMLISNIEQAFETQKYPWSKNIDFSDFCEYVLPYRVGTAPIEDWRTIYKNKFSHLVDSILNFDISDSLFYSDMQEYIKIQNQDSAFVAHMDSLFRIRDPQLIVSAILNKQYWTVIHYPKRFKPDPLPSQLLNVKVASCPEWSQLGMYIMRTFGIPTASDFTPNWAYRSMGHEWSVLLFKDNFELPFLIGDGQLGTHTDWFNGLPKVYRRTYSIQQDNLYLQSLKEKIPPLFTNLKYKDVSHHYFTPVDICIDLSIPPPEKKKPHTLLFSITKTGLPFIGER